jgi:hypothetical protein
MSITKEIYNCYFCSAECGEDYERTDSFIKGKNEKYLCEDCYYGRIEDESD